MAAPRWRLECGLIAWTPPEEDHPVLVDGKRLLITGVLTPGSIAYAVAREALDNGAEVVLTGFGRTRSLTERTARRLPREVDVLELDVNKPDDVRAVNDELAGRWGTVDGVLHAIAFAPADALGGNFLNTPYESASTAFQVSAFSLKELTAGLLPVLENHHASVVTLDFDARVAWPVYDWMGVCKAALESVTRYLARDLGPSRSGSTPSAPARSAPWPPRASPGSACWPTPGPSGPRSAGTSATRRWSPGSPCGCSRTGRGVSAAS